jgi:dipeptide/tripeptide permease
VINIGSLLASTAAPVLAHINIEVTYFIPFISMCCGFIVFLSFSKRYIMRPPEKEALFSTLALIGKRVACCRKFEDSKKADGVKRLLMVFPVTLLIVPFNIVYAQMSSVFIIQGQAMKASGNFDASFMSTFDAISCILSGIVLGSFIYPTLAKRGIHLPVTYKFAIGSVFATLAIVSGIIIDKAIKESYNNGEQQISVWFLGISFFLVGMGGKLLNCNEKNKS